MIARRLLLVLGAAALLLGLVFMILWLRASPTEPGGRPEVEKVRLFATARDIEAGSLLKMQDLHWRDIPAREVPVGALLQGEASADDLVGTALGRDLARDAPLLAEDLIRPGDPGFLPAVLGEGMVAVSIPAAGAEGVSGLIAPGDHVDVILTQSLNEPDIGLTQRAVSEKVLEGLRVLAVDRTISANATAATGPRLGNRDEDLYRTVTLEVTDEQAARLMVARQIGKVQLALRRIGEPRPGTVAVAAWAFDVSPALRRLQGASGPATERPDASLTVIDVGHGLAVERRCFDRTGAAAFPCPPLSGAPASASDGSP